MTKAIATPAAFEMLASPARQEPVTLLADVHGLVPMRPPKKDPRGRAAAQPAVRYGRISTVV